MEVDREARMDEGEYGALAHERRRRTLAVLEDVGTTLSLADLAIELARRETGVDEDVPHERARSIHVNLFHWHVPKLADAGLVDYDADRGTVALADGAKRSVGGDRPALKRA